MGTAVRIMRSLRILALDSNHINKLEVIHKMRRKGLCGQLMMGTAKRRLGSLHVQPSPALKSLNRDMHTFNAGAPWRESSMAMLRGCCACYSNGAHVSESKALVFGGCGGPCREMMTDTTERLLYVLLLSKVPMSVGQN